MMQIHFQVEGDPKGKGRPRFGRFGKFTRVYTDKRTLDYETLIKSFAAEAMGSTDPLETPVSVFLYIRHAVPQSYSKKRTEAYLDGMNGVIFKDDTQVIDLHVKKVYSAVAGVNVMVMEAE